MIVRLKTWPYVCVGRGEVVLVIEVCVGAIKIQKGEPMLIVRLNIFLGRCPAFCKKKLEIQTLLSKFPQQFMKLQRKQISKQTSKTNFDLTFSN